MNRDYDRYSLLRKEGSDMEPSPYIKISESSSDKYENWHKGVSRMDKLSNKYYGNPHYDFFILLANPKFLNEWEIPDYEVIRIPFSLDRVKSEYESKIERWMKL